MELISCDFCGVVFDKDKLVFSSLFDDDEINYGNIVYENGKYYAAIECPICEEGHLIDYNNSYEVDE